MSKTLSIGSARAAQLTGARSLAQPCSNGVQASPRSGRQQQVVARATAYRQLPERYATAAGCLGPPPTAAAAAAPAPAPRPRRSLRVGRPACLSVPLTSTTPSLCSASAENTTPESLTMYDPETVKVQVRTLLGASSSPRSGRRRRRRRMLRQLARLPSAYSAARLPGNLRQSLTVHIPRAACPLAPVVPSCRTMPPCSAC
jgi:hypothetical protein